MNSVTRIFGCEHFATILLRILARLCRHSIQRGTPSNPLLRASTFPLEASFSPHLLHARNEMALAASPSLTQQPEHTFSGLIAKAQAGSLAATTTLASLCHPLRSVQSP